MAKTYAYLFYTGDITLEDVKMMYKYHLEPKGMYYMANDEDNFVVFGTLNNLKKFADDYMGMELHPDYLYEEEWLDLEDFEEHTSDNKAIMNFIIQNDLQKSFGKLESKKSVKESIKESKEVFTNDNQKIESVCVDYRFPNESVAIVSETDFNKTFYLVVVLSNNKYVEKIYLRSDDFDKIEKEYFSRIKAMLEF